MSNSASTGKGARAKLFANGRSQAVRLPKEFRFDGKEVRIRRAFGGVLLEPVETSQAEKPWTTLEELYARMNAVRGDLRFPIELEEQPPAEERDPIL